MKPWCRGKQKRGYGEEWAGVKRCEVGFYSESKKKFQKCFKQGTNI
jgi:hypothetical protein